MATATATATKSKSKTVTPATPTVPTSRCDVEKVQVDSVFSRHSFGKVVEKSQVTNPATGKKITVLKLEADGLEWLVDAPILEKEFCFADQHDEEEKVSRTVAIEAITANPHTAMTISFRKKVDPKTVAKLLAEGQGTVTTRTWNKKVKEALAGEVSEMIGYHTSSFDEHQRLYFTKVGGKLDAKRRFRLVDPRTITKLVVGRAEFVVKAK